MNVLVLFLLEDELSDAFEKNENEKREYSLLRGRE